MELRVRLQRARWRALSVIALLAAGVFVHAQAKNTQNVKDVVIVHGAFADGSGWQSVYRILTKKGYSVTIVQNPTISLDDDVAATKRAIEAQGGPVILVGHSYGGAVISQAGSDPKVVGLVYIAAFALDNGESVNSWIKNWPAGTPAPPVLPPQDGFLLLDREKFPAAFAADVKPDEAEFMAISQVPWGVGAVNGVVTDAAWKTKPSWYLLTTEDHMIPPDTERFMAKRAGSKVVAIKASHAVFLSHPDAVASLIEQAASGAADMQWPPLCRRRCRDTDSTVCIWQTMLLSRSPPSPLLRQWFWFSLMGGTRSAA
jgi:pimeloyl-ACP methyl ester carboxylesterase